MAITLTFQAQLSMWHQGIGPTVAQVVGQVATADDDLLLAIRHHLVPPLLGQQEA